MKKAVLTVFEFLLQLVKKLFHEIESESLEQLYSEKNLKKYTLPGSGKLLLLFIYC